MIVPGILIIAFVVACSPNDAVARAPCACLPGFNVGTWIARNDAPPTVVCKCYKFVTDVGSWAESMAYCMTMGASLLRIEDAIEKKWVDNKLRSMQSTARHHLMGEPEYWIGATDLVEEGKWLWINTTSPMVDVKNNWLPKSKDNYQRSQNCLAMKRHIECKGNMCRQPVYGWFDDECYKRKFYVCESEPISIEF